MRYGTINADGFGVGWYAPGVRAEPAVYRRATPMWGDASFASVSGVVTSGCVLGAVRSATPGMPIEETATAPFTSGNVLLSHNGRIQSEAVARLLEKETDPLVPESRCDSAALAALLFSRLARGSDLVETLASVVVEAGGADPAARLNLLATDGTTVVASTWGDTLSYRTGEDGTVVASEPDDSDASWVDVPDRRLVVVREMTVTLRSLT
jgi:gamma-glutamyl hercynylcysteine S-oxide hydrolase